MSRTVQWFWSILTKDPLGRLTVLDGPRKFGTPEGAKAALRQYMESPDAEVRIGSNENQPWLVADVENPERDDA